jgi:Fanconi anemia group M protein
MSGANRGHVLKVLADHREARSEVPRRLREMGVEVVETALPVGDYVLSPRVGVERKTASDFVAALVRKRFTLQAQRLREAFERPVYVIEGRRLYGLRDVHPNFIRAGLATLTVTYGIPTVFTEGPLDTAAFLLLVARREQGELASGDLAVREVPPAYRKAGDVRDHQRRMLAALPQVGPHRAEMLLRHFGSVERLAAASVEDLTQVPGVGKVLARRIREAMAAGAGDEVNGRW